MNVGEMEAKKILITLLIGALLFLTIGYSVTSTQGSTTSNSPVFVDPKVLSEISLYGVANVIIILKNQDSPEHIQSLHAQAEILQHDLLSSLRVIHINASLWERITDWWNPADLVLNQQYQTIPALAGEIREEGLNHIILHPAVKAIFYDGIMHTLRIKARDQTNITPIHTITTQGTIINGGSKTICLIDTGIDYTHPELSPLYIGGKDIVNNDLDPMDDHGHGTHLSGIIHAMAPNTTIAAVKAINNQGAGSFSHVIAGIDWCTSNKQALNISIISMSIGDQGAYTPTSCPTVFNFAVASATASGIVVVAASGNDGATNGISLPSCTPNVISVGSVSRQDTISSFTNRGPGLDILAPGESINSTKMGGGYSTLSGTSVSTPFVAASIALLQHINSLQSTSMQPQDIETLLTGAGNNLTGWPRLNMYAAASSLLTPLPPILSHQIIFEDTSYGNLSVPLTLRNPYGQEISRHTNTTFNLTSGIYNLTLRNITLQNIPNNTGQRTELIILNLTIESINISTPLTHIKSQHILPPILPYLSTNGFALNAEKTSFSRIILSIQPIGKRIYTCPSWNMSLPGCFMQYWTMVHDDITPNTTYNLITYSTRPAFFFHTNSSPNRDTTLLETASGTNLGGDTILKTGNNSGRLRSLIYLNLTPLEANTTVHDATFIIHSLGNSASKDVTLGVYRVLAPWTEGTYPGQYQEHGTLDGATWNASTPTTKWQTPGGDLSSQPITTNLLNRTLNETNITFNITSFVQGIANQTWNNYGLAILSQEEHSSLQEQSFASSDHPNISIWPSISLTVSEHETTAPAITATSLSSNESFLSEAVCITANLTDQTTIPLGLATIINPNLSMQSVILLDNQSTCNSPGFDHQFSGHFIVQDKGLYTLVNVTASDSVGNQNVTHYNLSILAHETSRRTPYTSPISAQQGDSTIPILFLTTKNAVRHDFILPAKNRKEIEIVWNISHTTKWIDTANVSIDVVFSTHLIHLINQTIEYLKNNFNRTTWTPLCSPTISTINTTPSIVNTTSYCDLSTHFRTINELQSLTLRIVYTSLDTINHTIGIDQVSIWITAHNDTQPPLLFSEHIFGINQSPPNYSQHTTLTFSVNATDEESLDSITSQITLPNGTHEFLQLLPYPVPSTIGQTPLQYAAYFNQTSHIGTYFAIFMANDTTGNKNISPQLQFSIYESRNTSNATLENQTNDTKSPSISNLLISPTIANPGSQVNINATVIDDIGVALVIATLTQSNGSTFNISMISKGQNHYLATFFPTSTDPGGAYHLLIQSKDEAGNSNTSNIAWFTINDTTPPSIFDVIISIDNQSKSAPPIVIVNSSQHLQIKARSYDNTKVAQVYVLIVTPNKTSERILLTTIEGVYTGIYSLPIQAGTFTATLYSEDTNKNINSIGPISITTQVSPHLLLIEPPPAPVLNPPPVPLCTPSWTCTEFEICQAAKRTRTCTDQNQCQTTNSKPSEIQTCFGSTTILTTNQQLGQTSLASKGAGENTVHKLTTPSSQRAASIKDRGMEYAPFEKTPTPWYLTAILTISGLLGLWYLTLRPSSPSIPFKPKKTLWNLQSRNSLSHLTNKRKLPSIFITFIEIIIDGIMNLGHRIVFVTQTSVLGIWMFLEQAYRFTCQRGIHYKNMPHPSHYGPYKQSHDSIYSSLERACSRLTQYWKTTSSLQKKYPPIRTFPFKGIQAIPAFFTESIQGIILLARRIIHKLLR